MCAAQAGARDAADGRQPDRIAGDHDPLAVMPVHQRAGRQREQQVAEHGREAGDPGLGRRPGHREHQQRVGDLGDLRTEQGDGLAAPEQLEVPVAPERGHPVPFCPFGSTRGSAHAVTIGVFHVP
jgi:hypothetical protein